jgi:AcrR family transcriptional regulator
MIERSCYFLSMAAIATVVDGRRARGDSTRRAILARSMELASAEGLEGLSIARLASDLEMSKSGLFAHFGSKQELQLSTVRAARRVFSDEAITPALEIRPGILRLRALLDTWFEYIGSDTFPGGCLLMEAAAEFDNRPGRVRDLIAESMGMWMGLLVEQASEAIERDELAPGTDPEQLAWELHAYGLGLNWDRQLNESPEARERARVAVESRLKLSATTKGRRRIARR